MSLKVSRPKTFDPDAVLADAADLFRRHGYEGLGMQELVDGLGLSRSSLYATFGSKQDLYLAALERYRSAQGSLLLAALEEGEGPVLERIQDVLRGIGASLDSEDASCLVVNAACERGGTDTATTTLVCDQLTLVEEGLVGALRTAHAAGELSQDADIDGLAALLVTLLQGVRVLAQVESARTARAALREADRVLTAAAT